MPLAPNDRVPPPCKACGHLAMQHTRTPLGKRCIGNQWRCNCGLRPLSMVLPRLSLKPEEVAGVATENGITVSSVETGVTHNV